MLVLSRKQGESIVVLVNGMTLTFTAIEVRGRKVRLGVEAPKEVPVHRREVYEQICREGKREPPP